MKKLLASLVIALAAIGGTAATASASTPVPPGLTHVVWTSSTFGHGLENWEGVPRFYATIWLHQGNSRHDNAIVTTYWASGKHMTSYYSWVNGRWVFVRNTGTIPTED